MDNLKRDVETAGFEIAVRLRLNQGAYDGGKDRWALFRAEALSAIRMDSRFNALPQTIIRGAFDGCMEVVGLLGYVAVQRGPVHMGDTLLAVECVLLALVKEIQDNDE